MTHLLKFELYCILKLYIINKQYLLSGALRNEIRNMLITVFKSFVYIFFTEMERIKCWLKYKYMSNLKCVLLI